MMSTFGVSSLAGSSRNRSNKEAAQSKLERLHQEAKEILEQKAKEIADYNKVISEAETELAVLQAELNKRTQIVAQYEAENTNEQQPDHRDLIDALKAEHQAEIEKSQAKHQREVQKLQKKMQQSLQEAEAWAEHHAEVVLMEKTAQLQDLRRQLEEAKLASDRSVFTASQSRAQLYQQSKNASIMNAQRIQFLENQVGEITAITREELRDIKAKIDECLVAVELRNREHKNEAARYEQEIAVRDNQYNTHLQVLAEQFAMEKQRLEQAVASSQLKTDNLQKVLKQLEKQHEKQLQTTLRDVEKMKTSIYQTRTRQTEENTDTRNYVAQINALQRECNQTEQEIELVEKETMELMEENRELKIELAKLDNALYGSHR